MEMDFKCVFCGELEVSVYKQGDNIKYHCYECGRKYNQDILNEYKEMTVWQRVVFRMTHDLKE